MKQISLNRLFSALKPGESCLVYAASENAISAEFARLKPNKYTQRGVLVVDAESLETKRSWFVTRIE